MTNTNFHPDLRRVARLAPRSGFSPAMLPVIRAAQRLRSKRPVPGVEMVRTTNGVDIRLHRPPVVGPSPAPALLWIHGGGLVMGSPRQDDAMCRYLATALGITVAAVQYPLAPEHPYPAAIEACYDGLMWLSGRPDTDSSRIAIGGASAGGGLAAALAYTARDRGEVRLVKQLLVYPMLDDRTSDDPRVATMEYRLWSPRSNRFAWKSYLGGADPEIAVPARRTDLVGLPPAWVGVGTLDIFYHEDVAYADRLAAAGVPTELEVVPGAFHGFDAVASRTSVAQRFLATQAESLRSAFGLPG